MRPVLLCLLALGGCSVVDALENARTPSEAYYLIRNSEDERNPYENDPKYSPVYCTVDGVQFRSTVAACAESNGTASPVN